MKKLVCCTAALLVLVTALFLPTSCKPAAQFELVSLDIEPSEAVVGQQVTASIKVTNVGGGEGTYTAILKIDSVEIERKAVRVSPRNTETVTFAFVKNLPGNYNLDIGGLSRTLAIKARVPKTEFEVISLNVFPPEATAGRAVTIMAKVRNIGTSERIYIAVLMVDGVSTQANYIRIAPGAIETVTFSLVKDVAGTYEVGIGGLASRLEVKETPIIRQRIVLGNVPLVVQRGELDCGLASRAMLLRYYDDTISYEQSLYDSGACHGFVYKPGHLSFVDLGFISWHKDFDWLATLYGLTFEPRAVTFEGDEEAWEEFIHRVCDYLDRGVPVLTAKSWYGYVLGSWWGGIPTENRPCNHYVVITGVDRIKGVVYIHSPWPTLGKLGLTKEDFKTSIEHIRYPHLRYLTMVFLPAGLSGIEDREKAVRERNQRKLSGDARVYYEGGGFWGCVFGLKGLEAFREDLRPENLSRIIEEKERRGTTAAETVTWVSLFMYQHSFLSNLGAEYLEGIGKTNEEQKMLKSLHKSYDRLHNSSEKLESVFKSSKGTEAGTVECELILEGMTKIITEMIQCVEDYLEADLD